MAETPVKKPAAKPAAGKGISGKLGPLPVWAWGAIALVVFVIVYFVYSKNTGSATPSNTGTSTDTTGTSDLSSVTPTSSGNGILLTPEQYTAMVGGSGIGGNPTMADYLAGLEGLQAASNTAGQALNDSYVAGIQQGAAQQLPVTNTVQPTQTTAQKVVTAAKTTPIQLAQARGIALPKGYNASLVNGNLLSVAKLKTGAFVYSYKGGRKITQAKGKSPYVTAPGSGR